MTIASAISLGGMLGVTLMGILFYITDKSRKMAYIEPDAEDYGDEEESDELEDVLARSPFEVGEKVLIGNPHLREFTHYDDEDLCIPKAFVVERAVYDMGEDLFRYKLEGMPGFYSQGWLAPDMYGEQIKFYPHLDEPVPEVDERYTSTADSMRVAFALEDSQIDRALDILNSDSSERDKESARKYLRGETD